MVVSTTLDLSFQSAVFTSMPFDGGMIVSLGSEANDIVL
jgi:hypothetical protein